MTKILYAVPGIGLDKQELSRRMNILNSFATPPNIVVVEAVEQGPESIECFYDEYISIPNTLRLIAKAEREGYDAAIIGCFGDPGIEAAREIASIPIIGPGETSLLFAATLGHKFSILTVLKNVFPTLEKIADGLGVSKKIASMKEVGLRVLELSSDIERTKKRLLEIGREAVEEDDADALILGCMSEAFLRLDKELEKELRVPVVNPVAVSVKMAEALVAMQLTHSKKAYSLPHPVEL
ncbi:MAG: aspartate/glutamate racemase family protein [Nitrososphaerales archaeon]